MAFKYNSIVPWGRSFEEYIDMFHLTESDLDKRILGCGDGPASFNCTMKQKGKRVVSIDPIYRLTRREIEERIQETYEDVLDQTRKNQEKFIWSRIKSVEELGNTRMRAMKDFLTDYETGKGENRYVYAEMPIAPFDDSQFDLSLSSHFLFLYTDNLSLEFHILSVKELLRVSNEVRIFPLLDVNAERSPYVNKIVEEFSASGHGVKEEKVNYEFQRGGNRMLVIKREGFRNQ